MMPQVTTDDAGDLRRIDPRWALLCHCVLPDHLTLEVNHVLRLQRLNVGFSREGANPLLHIEKDGKFLKARKLRSERCFSIADAAPLPLRNRKFDPNFCRLPPGAPAICVPVCNHSWRGQPGWRRAGGISCRPRRYFRNASLRMRYQRCTASNCSAFARKLAKNRAMRR